MEQKKKRKKYWLRIPLLLSLVLFLLLLAGIGVASTLYPAPIAQWAVDNLHGYGFHGDVMAANIWAGDVRVKNMQFYKERKGTALYLTAKEGKIKLDVWSVVMGSRSISEIQVVEPEIHVIRGKRKGKAIPKKLQARKKTVNVKKLEAQVMRARMMVRRFRDSQVTVERFHIKNGHITFQDHSRPNRKMDLKIKKVETLLRDFKGKWDIRDIEFSMRSKTRLLEVKIPKGTMKVDLFAFLSKEPPALDAIVLEKPSFRMIRYAGDKLVAAKKPVKAKSVSERAKATKVLKERLKKWAPRIHTTRLIGGTFTLEDRSRPSRPMTIHIKEINGDLKDLAGDIVVRGLKFHRSWSRRALDFSLPKTSVHLDFKKLMAKKIVIPEVTFHQPNIRLTMKPRKRRGFGRKRRIPSWVQVGQVHVKDGTVDVRLTLPPQPGKAPRKLRLAFQKMHASVHDLDFRYLFAHPFEGKGRAHLLGIGPIQFEAKKLPKRAHIFTMQRLPMIAINRMQEGKKPPVEISRGILAADLTFKPYKMKGFPDELVKISSAFHVYNLKVSVRKGRLKGFKGMMARLAVQALNRYFVKLKKGYHIKAEFSMIRERMAQHPSRLFKIMARNFQSEFMNVFFKKHPTMARYRPMIEHRLGKRKKRLTLAQRLQRRREMRQGIRKARRKRLKEGVKAIKAKIAKRREKRREKRLQRRKDRREKLKERWGSFRKKW